MTSLRISLHQALRRAAPVVSCLLFGCGGDYAANPLGKGPAPVPIGTTSDPGKSGSYVILAKTGVTNVTGSVITGNVGVSPAAASFLTGFGLTADSSGTFWTSPSVVGKIFAADNTAPTPSVLTTAIGSMETAYTDAAGRSLPDFSELATGNLGGLTLVPGLYSWTTTVTIPSDVTLSGAADDTWIFQISKDLTMASGKKILLAGGALAGNIVWQVAGQVTIDTTAHFEGIILSKTAVTLNTGATLHGRIHAQTLVALDDNAVTQP